MTIKYINIKALMILVFSLCAHDIVAMDWLSSIYRSGRNFVSFLMARPFTVEESVRNVPVLENPEAGQPGAQVNPDPTYIAALMRWFSSWRQPAAPQSPSLPSSSSSSSSDKGKIEDKGEQQDILISDQLEAIFARIRKLQDNSQYLSQENQERLATLVSLESSEESKLLLNEDNLKHLDELEKEMFQYVGSSSSSVPSHSEVHHEKILLPSSQSLSSPSSSSSGELSSPDHDIESKKSFLQHFDRPARIPGLVRFLAGIKDKPVLSVEEVQKLEQFHDLARQKNSAQATSKGEQEKIYLPSQEDVGSASSSGPSYSEVRREEISLPPSSPLGRSSLRLLSSLSDKEEDKGEQEEIYTSSQQKNFSERIDKLKKSFQNLSEEDTVRVLSLEEALQQNPSLFDENILADLEAKMYQASEQPSKELRHEESQASSLPLPSQSPSSSLPSSDVQSFSQTFDKVGQYMHSGNILEPEMAVLTEFENSSDPQAWLEGKKEQILKRSGLLGKNLKDERFYEKLNDIAMLQVSDLKKDPQKIYQVHTLLNDISKLYAQEFLGLKRLIRSRKVKIENTKNIAHVALMRRRDELKKELDSLDSLLNNDWSNADAINSSIAEFDEKYNSLISDISKRSHTLQKAITKR